MDGATQEHRHAITGYAFLIDGRSISWSSKKQEIVTLSTTESEYVAAKHTAKEAIWLCWFIGEVFQSLTNPIPLYSDLQAAIELTLTGLIMLAPSTLTFSIILFDSSLIMGQLISFMALLMTWLPTNLPRCFPTLKQSILPLCLAYNWLEGGVLEYSRSIEPTEVRVSLYGIQVCSLAGRGPMLRTAKTSP